MHTRRLGILLGVVGLAVLAFAGIAGAAGAGSVSPNSNLVNNQAVNVDWSGLTPGQTVYITQCNNKPIAEISRVSDCSNVAEINIAGSYNATGTGETGTDPILNPDFRVFVGLEPSGDKAWICGPAGTAVPEGYTLYTTCQIKVTDSSPTATTNEFFVPITFGGGPVVPEAEYAVLLPLGALFLLGGVFFIVRNRRTASPAVSV